MDITFKEHKCLGGVLETYTSEEGDVYVTARSLETVIGYSRTAIYNGLKKYIEAPKVVRVFKDKNKQMYLINTEYVLVCLQNLQSYLQSKDRATDYEAIKITMKELSRKPQVEVKPTVPEEVIESIAKDNDDPNIVSLEDSAVRFISRLMINFREQDAQNLLMNDALIKYQDRIMALEEDVVRLRVDMDNIIANNGIHPGVQVPSQWQENIDRTPGVTTTNVPEDAPIQTIYDYKYTAFAMAAEAIIISPETKGKNGHFKLFRAMTETLGYTHYEKGYDKSHVVDGIVQMRWHEDGKPSYQDFTYKGRQQVLNLLNAILLDESLTSLDGYTGKTNNLVLTIHMDRVRKKYAPVVSNIGINPDSPNNYHIDLDRSPRVARLMLNINKITSDQLHPETLTEISKLPLNKYSKEEI